MSATTLVERRRRKVVVYATFGGRILLFEEPEYPHVGWQPPGGTVRPDEAPDAAAEREFEEETGFPPRGEWRALGVCTYRYALGGFDHIHERHFYHLALAETLPENFETLEATPDGGGPPIRFCFFWCPLSDPALTLYASLDTMLPELQRRIAPEGRL